MRGSGYLSVWLGVAVGVTLYQITKVALGWQASIDDALAAMYWTGAALWIHKSRPIKQPHG
jgi:hypothetical protein